MAASGINEHHEACRKQNFINRQTYMKQMLLKQMGGDGDDGTQALEEDLNRKLRSTPGHLGPLSSYEREQLHKKYGAAGTDKERRRIARQQQCAVYSAKLPDRLSSTNYTQQW